MTATHKARVATRVEQRGRALQIRATGRDEPRHAIRRQDVGDGREVFFVLGDHPAEPLGPTVIGDRIGLRLQVHHLPNQRLDQSAVQATPLRQVVELPVPVEAAHDHGEFFGLRRQHEVVRRIRNRIAEDEVRPQA